MKKLKNSFFVLSLALLAGTLVSCSNDEETVAPTISFINVTNNKVEVEPGIDSYTIVAQVAAEEKIASISLYQITETAETPIGNPVTSGFDDSRSHNFRREVSVVAAGTYKFKVEVVDKTGKKAAQILTIVKKAAVVTPTETALSAAVAFTLGRPANASNPESAYGIKYNQNLADAVTAEFTGSFVVLSKADFDAIKTKEALKAKFDGSTAVGKVEIKSDARFVAVYFISKNAADGKYYLVEATGLNFIATTGTVNIAKFKQQN